jgi:hypothetical protein
MDAKRFGCPQDKWRTSQISIPADAQLVLSNSPHLLGSPSLSGASATLPEISISIPSTAKAIAGTCYPINVTVRVPRASKPLLDLYVQTTTVQLVKVIRLSLNGINSTHARILGNCRVKQVEKELVAEDTRIIRASAAAGTLEGEASWKIDDLISVEVCTYPNIFHLLSMSMVSSNEFILKHLIRVGINPKQDPSPLLTHDEPIEMFSHSKKQFDDPFEIRDAPALRMLKGLINNRAADFI